jgi:glycosyltransferase involved in cell wall biosynthesis
MNSPKILHILQCTNLGGMERCTLEMMSALRGLNCDNRLVSLNPLGGLGKLLAERSFAASGLPYRRPAGIPSIPRMAREFRRGGTVDGIVMSGHNMAAFAALAGMECKRRVLYVHFHHAGVKSRWQWRLVYATAMRVFPRIAFCSDFIRTEAEEIYPPLREVSVTHRNSYPLPPVPLEQDKQAARRALGLPGDALVVGNAGWLIERKRWDVFLRTAAKIAEQVKNVIFLISGDGPLRQELVAQAKRLELEDRIRWLGWQDDLTSFYLSLDLLLFNSDWDALGRTPLEAGSYQVPAVTSVLNGGLNEVISSDEVGYLLDRHDEDWLAEKAIRLLGDASLRHRMGAACRQVLAERHDPMRNALAMLNLLGIGHASTEGAAASI